MPREADPERLRKLREVFADTASNVPEFTETAELGGYRSDEGLQGLLPDLAPYGRRLALKQAIVRFLDAGERPTREDSVGDQEMQIDAAVYYHFRVTVEDVRLFVKVLFEDAPDEPEVLVISVKRDDR